MRIFGRFSLHLPAGKGKQKKHKINRSMRVYSDGEPYQKTYHSS